MALHAYTVRLFCTACFAAQEKMIRQGSNACSGRNQSFSLGTTRYYYIGSMNLHSGGHRPRQIVILCAQADGEDTHHLGNTH